MVPENSNWRAESYTNIDTYRKSNINFVFTVPSNVPQSALDVQIRLKKHSFVFGVRANDANFRAKDYTYYRNLVFSWFNTITINSINWKYNAGNETNPNYSKALSAIDVVRANGLKVRAHCIHRDTPDNIPNWVTALKGQELRDTVDFHIQQMVNLTRGKLFHWCVMNEHLQGMWYEERLQDPNITKNIFKYYNQQNPDAKAFLNDFTGVTAGGNTQAMYDMLMEYKSEGIPIDGLGIQGHTKISLHPILLS
ncbi:uncharacterized protein LOC112554420 isoform X2 [Pomacea canaliculata]|uniref:uncharacterized protein LOC112554420 isoform X2 n=1 Tax=Pomacea canaliculata TaxID=400727 RepID=UPI000D729224|nr:uncharacterized protein LOC112554420 isoform X2 [Pomacea canaliculata]